MLVAIYRLAFIPGVCVAGAALLCAGILAVTAGDRADGSAVAAFAVVLWITAILTAVILYLQRRDPTTMRAVVTQIVALVSSGSLYGALRRSVSAPFVAFAVLIFFVFVVVATVLRADEPRRPNTSALG
jgi:hypothetical protein